MLSNKENRKRYVAGIANGLKEVWETVKRAGLVR